MRVTPEYLLRALYYRLSRAPGRNIRACALKRLGFAIGDDVYIGPGLTITAGIADKSMRLELGDRVSIGPNVTFVLASHPNNSHLKKYIKAPERRISIGHDTWLGAGCIILPGVTIGENCIVGAGAVVTKDVKPNSVVAGVPARFIKSINLNITE